MSGLIGAEKTAGNGMCLSVTFNESSTLNTEINGTDVIFKKDILFLIKNLKTMFLNKIHNIIFFS